MNIFRRKCAVAVLFVVFCLSFTIVSAETIANATGQKRVAAICSIYFKNSHADVLASRLVQTQTLDGKGEKSPLTLVSIYTDLAPETHGYYKDISRDIAKEYGVKICDTIEDALTLGTGDLAVDGILMLLEWCDYPVSEVGQIQYPKKRFFEETVKVFKKTGKVVPVYIDKNISDDWEGSKWIYDTAREMNIPLMAGSCLPGVWRYPEIDLQRGRPLKELVAISYHTLDCYGFHGLEMAQCVVERRKGDETGIKSVQCLSESDVWKAGREGVYDTELLKLALSRIKRAPDIDKLPEKSEKPALFIIEYEDGLRVNVLNVHYAVGEWACAWRYGDDNSVESTLFALQNGRPFMHFAYQLKPIERMILTGKPTWPAERTLLTSGALNKLLLSKKEGGKAIETPYMKIKYKCDWDWFQPPPSPPDRDIYGQ